MKIIEAITTIKTAIDASVSAKSDSTWKAAIDAAGLVSQGRKDGIGIDEDYLATFGPLELRFVYKWYDTSKTFSPGPDRTRLTLEIIENGRALDEYRNSYDD